MKRLTTYAALIISVGGCAWSQESVVALLERKLMSRLQVIDRDLGGVLGVVAIDLKTGAILQHNADAVFPQASSIKIPIMAEVFRQIETGKLKQDSSVTLKREDAVGGSGNLQVLLKRGPVTVTIRELVDKMIRDSDNTATNQLIGMVGMASVNQWIASAAMRATKLQRPMMDSEAAKAGRENISTPIEMAQLAQKLYEGKAVSADASRTMIDILKRVRGDFRISIPASVPVASKPGDLNGVRAETGIVFLANRPFVLSVMSTFLADKTNPIPAVVRLFYRHFEKLGNSNAYGHKLQ